MKKKGYISASLVLILVVSYAVWYSLTKKEYICHIDSTTGTRTTISARWFEKSKHLAHGDFLGTCEELRTYVPDDAFEYQLILLGYDDVMDDYVLTSIIEEITNLSLTTWFDDGSRPGDYIMDDLTGLEDFSSLVNLSISALPHGWGEITEIDLTQHTTLTNLSLYELVNVTHLDLSKNTALIELTLIEMQGLTHLNLKNGNNEFQSLPFIEARNISCFQVDDAAWSTINWSTDYIYSENCWPF